MRSISGIFVIAVFALAANVAQAEGYKFTVHNKSSHKMTNLLVSEDGKTWGKFDLNGGIEAGASAVMEWDSSTDGENCEQQVKAAYADKSESAAASFDFCEDNLELEFE